jgi:hypothetical protein
MDIYNKVPWLGKFDYSPIYLLVKKEAGKIVLRLLKDRQGQFVTSDMATEGAGAAGAAGGGGVVDFGSLK